MTTSPSSTSSSALPRFVAKFTHGSILKHVSVMTATGSIGLMAIFLVDFLNLFYISLLGDAVLTAAIGYAFTLLFFITSVGIGISIAITALVSRALGAHQRDDAMRFAASGLLYMLIIIIALSVLLMVFARPLVALVGAQGQTALLTERFLLISTPSMPFLGMGMAFAGVLRALGDARRAMWVTLGGGLATAVLDPLFIFTLHLGFDGAAIVTIFSRILFCGIGFWGAVRVHHMLAPLKISALKTDLKALNTIAIPAILTNIATPVANGFLTYAFAAYGDAAVAALAIISRLINVIFGGAGVDWVN